MTRLQKMWSFRALLPSFVSGTIWPEDDNCHSRRHKQLHPTSYLDGLRGIAAMIVFICHYTEKRHGYLLPTYGLQQVPCTDSDEIDMHPSSSFLQLPFIRVLYSGRPMVHIFFVVSGFALSYRPLGLLHGPEGLNACYAALASSAFRRPVRLFLPCAVSTFAIAVLAQTGQLYAADKTWYGQLNSWARTYAGRIAWPWAWDRDLRPGYNIHLWTIPIEFAHAMLLFLVLLALVPLKTRLRQVMTVLLAGHCLACGRWAAFEFLAGLFLAEVHILRSNGKSLKGGHTLTAVFHSIILASCLFVAGWPNEGANQTPGIRTLLANTPSWFLSHGRDEALASYTEDWGEYLLEQKFWFAIVAVLFVWSCGELSVVQQQFERPVAQYCGRISYSVYLVHGPALDYWEGLADSLVGPIGMETATQRTMTWLAGLVILGALIVWLADVFWRLVDAPIVALGRAVEKACLQEDTSKKGAHQTRESKDHGTDDLVTIVVG